MDYLFVWNIYSSGLLALTLCRQKRRLCLQQGLGLLGGAGGDSGYPVSATSYTRGSKMTPLPGASARVDGMPRCCQGHRLPCQGDVARGRGAGTRAVCSVGLGQVGFPHGRARGTQDGGRRGAAAVAGRSGPALAPPAPHTAFLFSSIKKAFFVLLS